MIDKTTAKDQPTSNTGYAAMLNETGKFFTGMGNGEVEFVQETAQSLAVAGEYYGKAFTGKVNLGHDIKEFGNAIGSASSLALGTAGDYYFSKVPKGKANLGNDIDQAGKTVSNHWNSLGTEQKGHFFGKQVVPLAVPVAIGIVAKGVQEANLIGKGSEAISAFAASEKIQGLKMPAFGPRLQPAYVYNESYVPKPFKPTVGQMPGKELDLTRPSMLAMSRPQGDFSEKPSNAGKRTAGEVNNTAIEKAAAKSKSFKIRSSSNELVDVSLQISKDGTKTYNFEKPVEFSPWYKSPKSLALPDDLVSRLRYQRVQSLVINPNGEFTVVTPSLTTKYFTKAESFYGITGVTEKTGGGAFGFEFGEGVIPPAKGPSVPGKHTHFDKGKFTKLIFQNGSEYPPSVFTSTPEHVGVRHAINPEGVFGPGSPCRITTFQKPAEGGPFATIFEWDNPTSLRIGNDTIDGVVRRESITAHNKSATMRKYDIHGENGCEIIERVDASGQRFRHEVQLAKRQSTVGLISGRDYCTPAEIKNGVLQQGRLINKRSPSYLQSELDSIQGHK